MLVININLSPLIVCKIYPTLIITRILYLFYIFLKQFLWTITQYKHFKNWESTPLKFELGILEFSKKLSTK